MAGHVFKPRKEQVKTTFPFWKQDISPFFSVERVFLKETDKPDEFTFKMIIHDKIDGKQKKVTFPLNKYWDAMMPSYMVKFPISIEPVPSSTKRHGVRLAQLKTFLTSKSKAEQKTKQIEEEITAPLLLDQLLPRIKEDIEDKLVQMDLYPELLPSLTECEYPTDDESLLDLFEYIKQQLQDSQPFPLAEKRTRSEECLYPLLQNKITSWKKKAKSLPQGKPGVMVSGDCSWWIPNEKGCEIQTFPLDPKLPMCKEMEHGCVLNTPFETFSSLMEHWPLIFAGAASFQRDVFLPRILDWFLENALWAKHWSDNKQALQLWRDDITAFVAAVLAYKQEHKHLNPFPSVQSFHIQILYRFLASLEKLYPLLVYLSILQKVIQFTHEKQDYFPSGHFSEWLEASEQLVVQCRDYILSYIIENKDTKQIYYYSLLLQRALQQGRQRLSELEEQQEQEQTQD